MSIVTKDNDQELERLRQALQAALLAHKQLLLAGLPTDEAQKAVDDATAAYKRRRFWVVEQTKDRWESEI